MKILIVDEMDNEMDEISLYNLEVDEVRWFTNEEVHELIDNGDIVKGLKEVMKYEI